MWSLYRDFEVELDNQSVFNPGGDLGAGLVQGQPPTILEYELVHAIVECVRPKVN